MGSSFFFYRHNVRTENALPQAPSTNPVTRGSAFFTFVYISPNLAKVLSSSISPQAAHCILYSGPLYGIWKGSRSSFEYCSMISPDCGFNLTGCAIWLIKLKRVRFVLQFGQRYGVLIVNPLSIWFAVIFCKIKQIYVYTREGFMRYHLLEE